MANALGNRSEVAGMLAGSKELRNRILFVLMALVVYRLGTHIPLPGIDATALASYQDRLQQGVLGMLNLFSGGAFSRMTIFALNIMPYITASIIIQLLSATYSSLKDLKKEGEAGRRKINQYTRYLTVVLAFSQGFGLATSMEGATVVVGSETLQVVLDAGMMFRLQTALTLMTGTVFLMWLGEQINSRGIGNGISILIFAGIVAELPSALFQTFEMARTGSMSNFLLLGIGVMVFAVIAFITYMETAQRRVLVQYPKRQMAGGQSGGEASHMPLKINMAGVIPPIFASSLLLVPASIANFSPNAEWAQLIGGLFSPGKPLYTGLYVALIVFFCFFYTALQFNPDETADNLKSNGGFIPGVRPGKSTSKYFDYVMTRLTVVGAAYISLVCILPEIVNSQFSVPFYFGGTSLLIVVSVTMDLVTRIQTHLITQKYESLLKKTQFKRKKRSRA